MKIVLNTYKICADEREKFIVIKLSDAESSFKLYQEQIMKAKVELLSDRSNAAIARKRELKNLESICEQIISHLEANNIPYTLMDNNGFKTLTISEVAKRVRHV